MYYDISFLANTILNKPIAEFQDFVKVKDSNLPFREMIDQGYHISTTAKGHNIMSVFFDDTDRRQILRNASHP